MFTPSYNMLLLIGTAKEWIDYVSTNDLDSLQRGIDAAWTKYDIAAKAMKVVLNPEHKSAVDMTEKGTVQARSIMATYVALTFLNNNLLAAKSAAGNDLHKNVKNCYDHIVACKLPVSEIVRSRLEKALGIKADL